MSGVDVLAVMDEMARVLYVRAESDDDNRLAEQALQARAAVAELIADANRWRAVVAVHGGLQARGDQFAAYISTPIWVGDWASLNNAVDRQFGINEAARVQGGQP